MKAWRFVLLLPLALLYWMTLPRTVQGLDSGEMVAAGMRLWVAHPPGYPLYCWLLHGFLQLVPWGEAFTRAAFLGSLCALTGLALLIALAETWSAAFVVAVLGTLPVVWRYAVIPDVFALHVLLSTAVIYFALAPNVRHRELPVCLAFGLAAANHLTVIFLAPLVVLTLIGCQSWRRATIAAVLGASVCVVLYASLALFDGAAPQSWSNLHDARDIVNHFLRSDYGTLTLYTRGGSNVFWPTLCAFGVETWPALLLCVVAIASYARLANRSWWGLLICLCLIVGPFLAATNVPDQPIFYAMRERFFVLPAVLAAAIAVIAKTPSWTIGPSALLIVANVWRASCLFDLPRERVLDDYAHNILDTAAAEGKPSFLILDGDSEYSAVVYTQANGDGRDVIALHSGRALDARQRAKLQMARPALRFGKQTGTDTGALIRDFIEPNVETFDFTHTLRLLVPRLRTIYYPVGRKLVAGSGVGFAEAPRPPRYGVPVYDLDAAYAENKAIYAEYADYYLALGRATASAGDDAAAIHHFREGLEIVPWCTPCRDNACALEKKLGVDTVSCQP